MADPIDYLGPIRWHMSWESLLPLADHIEETMPHRADFATLLRSDVHLNVNGQLPFNVSESDYAIIKKRYPVPSTHMYCGLLFTNPVAQWYTVVSGSPSIILRHPEIFKQWPIHTIEILSTNVHLEIHDTRAVLNNSKVSYIKMYYPSYNDLTRIIPRLEYMPHVTGFTVIVRTNEIEAKQIFSTLKVNLRVHKDCLLRVINGSSVLEGEK